MKKLILYSILALIAAALLSFQSCELIGTPEPKEEAPVVEVAAAGYPTAIKINGSQDTLTNAETESWALMTVNGPVEYEFSISADSISGTTTATCYLLQNIDFAGSDKIRIATVTVNHAPYRYRATGTIVGGVLTCDCTSTGTQVTHVRPDLNVVPRIPN